MLAVAGAAADAVALWAVFRLARSIVGERQGALATVLAAGVAWVTWLPPALDADRLLLPLFALAALHLWRAAAPGPPPLLGAGGARSRLDDRHPLRGRRAGASC